MQNGIDLKQFYQELDALYKKRTVPGPSAIWKTVYERQKQNMTPPGSLQYATSWEVFVVPWVRLIERKNYTIRY